MNIKQILNRSTDELKNSGSVTPELDAKVLLREAIKKDASFVFSHPEHLITNSGYSLFRSYIRRRKKGEGVAYILGQKEFYGLDFYVNKNVLIPRPETEWLVERGIDFIKNTPRPITVLDMGTGSGCIIISLAREGLDSKYCAADNSKQALKVAKKNAKKLGVRNIKFYFSDLFKNRYLHKQFDLIIANLPYVPRSSKNASVAFEPEDAIFADDNGTAIIKRLLSDSKARLKEAGMILLEADCRNAKEVLKFAKKEYPDAQIELKKDLANLDRYIVIKK